MQKSLHVFCNVADIGEGCFGIHVLDTHHVISFGIVEVHIVIKLWF